MLFTLIYPIKFVPLRHDKEHRRDTSLSASSTGERLAYILHLDRRDGGKHPCGTGICKARCYGSRPALPDTGLLSSPSHSRSSIILSAYSCLERAGSMYSIRITHSPPLLFAESQESKAAYTFPECMRPVGEGAKRPFIIEH